MTDELLETLRRAAGRARELGADDVELAHTGKRLGMSRFANSALTTSGVVREQATRVRVAVGMQLGSASTSSLEPAALDDATAQALESARAKPPSTTFQGFARPSLRAPRGHAGYVAATAAHSPADRAAVLGRVFERAAKDQLLCAGTFNVGTTTTAVVTGGGVALAHEQTSAVLSVIALDGGTSGYATCFHPDVNQLPAEALAEEACTKAVRGRDPVELDPGAYDVILSPPAVTELLEWMAMASFTGRSLADGTSLLAGRRGERVCDERITILDDPGFEHPTRATPPFDCEGTITLPVTMIDRGLGGDVVTDLAAASRLGDPRGSTGHAMPNYFDGGAIPSNLVLLPGPDSPSELLARVERGLYITRFHYVNGLLDTRRATMTGMTRDGTFVIEDGRLGRGIKNLRFTESILDAFGRLGGIGRELVAIPTTWTTVGAYLTPALLVRGFHFTGRSR